MALPLAIPLIMGGVSAAQTIMGGIQSNKARNAYENAVAPSLLDSKAYETAQTTQNLTGRWAQTGIPEQSMRFQEDMIGRSGAAALGSVGSLRQGVMGAAATAQSLGDQYRSLASMDANQRIANRTQYLGARQNVQNIEMQQGERDYGLFLNDQAMRLAQMSAGRDSMSQGMQGMTNAAGLGFQASLTPEAFGGWMKDGAKASQAAQGGVSNFMGTNPASVGLGYFNPSNNPALFNPNVPFRPPVNPFK